MIPFEEEQELLGAEDQMWCAKERTIIARTKQYLERSYSLKVEVEELEDLLGPDDVDLDFRRIQKGCATFETFSTDGPSEFLVVSRFAMGQAQKEVGRTVETKFVGLCK